MQTLPGKRELEALEHNLIRRQNTLSIKDLCRSLLPRNMLLSGVMNIITSMLIQVHATARLISGLVQIAKQTPAGIQSDNTQIDHARREFMKFPKLWLLEPPKNNIPSHQKQVDLNRIPLTYLLGFTTKPGSHRSNRESFCPSAG